MPFRSINIAPSRVRFNFEVPFSNINLLGGGTIRNFQTTGFWRATLTYPTTDNQADRDQLRSVLSSLATDPNAGLSVPLLSLGTVGTLTSVTGSAVIDPVDRTLWTVTGIAPREGEIISVWRSDAPDFATARTVLEVNGSVIRIDHSLFEQFGSVVVVSTGNPFFRGIAANSRIFQWLMTSGLSEREISIDLVEDVNGQANSLRSAACIFITDDDCPIVDDQGCNILV